MEYRFADCLLDGARHSLMRAGDVVPVEPLVFDLIHMLVRHAGELVARERMIEEIWHGRIVSDSAVSACIASARRVVGDDGKRQEIIRTVSRRGLTLVAEVSVSESAVRLSASHAVQRIRYARNGDGHRLAYALTGEGTPVVRFPPPLTMDLVAEWTNPPEREFVDRLSARFRFLRFDNLGSGQSERVTPTFSFADQADDAAAIADAVGIDRLAAWSMSGGVLTAIHFAVRYPERLSRLAIVGGYADGRSRRNAAASEDSLKSMITEGWAQSESAFATAFMTSYFPEGPLDDVRALVRNMQIACPPDIMLKDRDAINSASVADLLEQVQCPVLVLHARGDAVHPLSEARKLVAGIPDAELVILETANHVPYPGNVVWEPFIDTLIGFLAG